MTDTEIIDGNHPDPEVILEYGEQSLIGAPKLELEAHLEVCQLCAKDLEQLLNLTSTLKTSKQYIFCPELWELYDFSTKGDDPHKEMLNHLPLCPVCAEHTNQLRESTLSTQELPLKVKRAFETYCTGYKRSSFKDRIKSILAHFNNKIALSFQSPLIPLAAVVSIILMVVLIYPRPELSTQFALSSISWKSPQLHQVENGLTDRQPISAHFRAIHATKTKPGASQSKKTKVAVLVILKGFETEVPQEKIDLLYSSIGSSNLTRLLTILNPAEVKQFILQKEISPDNKEGLLNGLRQDKKVDKALFVTITSSHGQYEVSGKLLDARSRKLEKEKTWHSQTIEGVESKLKQTIPFLFSFKNSHS